MEGNEVADIWAKAAAENTTDAVERSYLEEMSLAYVKRATARERIHQAETRPGDNEPRQRRPKVQLSKWENFYSRASGLPRCLPCRSHIILALVSQMPRYNGYVRIDFAATLIALLFLSPYHPQVTSMSPLLLHNLAPMPPWHLHSHITISNPNRPDPCSIQFKLKFSVCKEGNDSEEAKGARMGPQR